MPPPARYLSNDSNDQPKEARRIKDQVRAKAEEMKGKVTGDNREHLKGKARQTAGKAESMVRDIQADVREEVDKRRDHDRDDTSR